MEGTENIVRSSTSGGNNVGNDASNSLYVHPSDNPGMTLVPIQFDGTRYRSWRRGVLRALLVKNKLGFIDGSCEKPPADSPTSRQWQRCDDMVTSWILNSLTKEISDSVKYVNDSVELWKELEDRYDQTNGAKLYQIQKEINDLTQGTLDITIYYTRMKKLWEELNTLNMRNQCTCICNCGARDGMYKAEQDRRLIQFLMGMNEVYTMQGSNGKELQGNLFKGYLAGNNNVSGNNNYGGANYYSGSDINTKFCDYCKKSGHIKEKCNKLHGYHKDTTIRITGTMDIH
ncbi:hypothetical protein KY290_023591 [Solanum tuberosum]|uniref:Retrotransposon Copia-like N-terminal domain-containing protein n=1 Tax=Solanum tuberosum TaxID=4113 RepID=A0ABQ7V7N4_SOLTU|nr:hypothetical protein KY284_021391 [Solanum tuberosum]KAH0683857.1 hypothetical protein KY289_021609 [Solanum tuberosum]KAH0760098.1 hypothetical protein KY290_023591 [Solanum tuberosum]